MTDAGPQGRNLPAAAFDSQRSVVVLYGGTGVGSGTRYGDTWEWDGQRWTEKSVRTPGPRDHHAMAFDEARGNVVICGGLAGPNAIAW
ncbi:MAG: kelch repeat-containing protein [Longimicrobiales bacterium]